MAGRPAKSVNVQSGEINNDQKTLRTEIERGLKGNADKVKPPKHLSKDQKVIFKNIVDELKSADILSNLDVYILTHCAVAVGRLYEIEKMVNEDPAYLFDSALMGAKNKYAQEFFRCCNELCLSPQARAKIGSIAASALNSQKISDPIADMLGGIDEDD